MHAARPWLATVVAVAIGLSPSAHAVSDEGRRVGSVSGGCLERDVVRHASRSIASGKAVLRLYDSLDEDLAEGFAMGCNGAVLVMIEPVNAVVNHHIQFQADCLQRRSRGAIATVYSARPSRGRRLAAGPRGNWSGR
jgi:xanthine/CO dehydrogenase XdhC/CoxF family maturation factor